MLPILLRRLHKIRINQTSSSYKKLMVFNSKLMWAGSTTKLLEIEKVNQASEQLTGQSIVLNLSDLKKKFFCKT